MTSTSVSPAQPIDLESANRELRDADAQAIVRWSAAAFGRGFAMTSSFGAQSAVMLHLVTREAPQVPVILIDTGYLFPETYLFVEQLRESLKLNLRVYQSPLSPAWMEARLGKLWEQGKDGLDQYDQLRKVEPLQRALRELNVTAWASGVRAQQTEHRATLRTVELGSDGIYKVHPILRWTGKDVHEYLKKHNLPYHPLVEKGYRSIGDSHSTFPVGEGQNERDGRFRGLKQECGIHLPATPAENQSRESSGL